MWTEALKNGKYKARERYLDPLTGKTKIVSVTIEKDTPRARKAAQEQLRVKIEELQEEKKDSNLTIEELAGLYGIHQQNTVKPQSWKRDKVILEKITDLLGRDTLADRLSARYITETLEKSKKENVTRNTYLVHIKKFLRWAYRNDYVESVAYLDKIRPWTDNTKERIEDKYLTSDELETLLKGMKVQKWKLLTEFLALSGLRIGEAMALLDTDITDIIVVNKTMDLNTGSVTDSAKTDAGNRDVFVQEELEPVIRKIRKEKLLDQVEHGYRTDRFLFDFYYQAYNKYLKETTKRLLNHSITPHALRHTHVSLLAEQGVSLDVISRRVGHEGSDVTRKIYLHITERQKKRDHEKVSKIRLLNEGAKREQKLTVKQR